jgi:hypothetical protein
MSIFKKETPAVSGWSKFIGVCIGVIIVSSAVILGLMALEHIISLGMAAGSFVVAGATTLITAMTADPTVTPKKVHSSKFADVG